MSRRPTDEMHAQARRRLAALARPAARPEVPLNDPDDPDDLPEWGGPDAADEPADPVGPGEQRGTGGRPPGRPLDLLVARLPTTVRDGRVAVSRTAAIGLALVALLALVLAGSYAWRARAVPAVLPAAPSEGRSAGPMASASGLLHPSGVTSPAGEVVVDVAGKVVHPGVVRLPLGSRVVDAIAAAGGVRGHVDVTSLNLARVLTDGEQVLVGADAQAAGSAPTPAAGAAAPPDGVVDLNTATLEQLDTLPGVGPVLAQRILDWRSAHGRFSTIDELREVSGIGDSRFADLAPRVRV